MGYVGHDIPMVLLPPPSAEERFANGAIDVDGLVAEIDGRLPRWRRFTRADDRHWLKTGAAREPVLCWLEDER